MATVLVVEDEPAVRLGVRLALERAGHRVLEAESAEAAWPLLKEAEAVVLDWMLPGEPGTKLLAPQPPLGSDTTPCWLAPAWGPRQKIPGEATRHGRPKETGNKGIRGQGWGRWTHSPSSCTFSQNF